MLFHGSNKVFTAIIYVIFIAAGLFAPIQKAMGQEQKTHSLLFRGTPMEAALEELVQLTQLDLVYANELVKGKRVFCSKRDANAEVLLRCVLGESGIDYIRSSSGTYILINSLQQPPLLGDLAGSITDLETGDPLPYANILLADGSSGTTTNQDGFFSFKSLLSGEHQLVVTYVGYETSIDSITVTPGQRNRISIQLKASENSVGPIVIDGIEQRIPSQTLSGKAIKETKLLGMSSLGTPDVMRGATTLAGITVQQPLAGIQIQGGLGNEHVTLLDGVPVRDPVTLGRYLGAFSPLALNRMMIYKAGYGAEHGSHLTGVVAVSQDLASTKPYHATLMLDPVSLNGQMKGKFSLPGNREGVVMAALRTSNWDVYQDRSVMALLKNWNGIDPFITALWSREDVTRYTLDTYSQKPLVSFSDLHFATRFKLSPTHNVHASMYRAGNNIKSSLIAINDLTAASTNDLFVLTGDSYSWLNWAGQVKHSWLLSSKSALSTQVKASSHNSRFSYRALNARIADQASDLLIEETATLYKDTLAQELSSAEHNYIGELSLNTTLSHSFSPFYHADIGLEATVLDTRFNFHNAFIQQFQHDLTTSNIAGFIQNRLALNAYTSLEPGLRLTYLPINQNIYAEPRLAIRLDNVSPSLGGYALRLAGGIYRQFVNQYDLTTIGTTSAAPSILFWLPLDETQSPPRAYHLAFDALLTPGSRWTLGVEAFMKWQQVLTLDYANLQQLESATEIIPQNRFISRARGRSYGGSLQVEYEGRRLGLGLTYDYIKVLQQFPDRFNSALVPVPWHTPNRFKADLKTKLTNELTLEANWISQWGRKWALRRAYYDFLAFRSMPNSLAPFDLTNPMDHSLPIYNRLDLGASLSIPSNRVSSSIQLFVTNVLNHDNVFDQQLSLANSGAHQSPRLLPGRQFTLSVRVDY